MSESRRDLHKAKLRRDRIRREKHAQRAPAAPAREALPPSAMQHPFAAERAMREIHALVEGQKYGSVEDLNARLAELTAEGRVSEMANAWKRDDPKWRAQELAYDALEADSVEHALKLVDEALKLDPDCIDAQGLMASIMAPTVENKLHLMREVVNDAEANLGESFFQEHLGHFWGTISTRPYMRAKQHLGELLAQTGRFDEAIAVYERMLELNPNDNQGMRFPLLGLYLSMNRPDAANDLIGRHPEEEKFVGSIAWARVLERWLAGSLDEAKAALTQARRINRYAEGYLAGVRATPKEAPEYYRPGEESEGQTIATELRIASEAHPNFREWLRAQR